jgi:hypothetical protein
MLRLFIPAVLAVMMASQVQASSHRRGAKGHAPMAHHKPVPRHAPASRAHKPVAHHRRIRLGLVPHHKGVANLFWNTHATSEQPIDPTQDNTLHKSIPLNGK